MKIQIQSQNRLSNKLVEISGIECLNDTVFFAINDGGNKSCIFQLNASFEIQKEIELKSFKNYDWEDLAIDKEFLYIADVGNNNNNRKNLRIARIKIEDLLHKKEFPIEIMDLSYANQKEFPPDEKNLNFDAETLISDGGKLYIFSKNRTKPFSGKTFIYEFTFQKNSKIKLSPTYVLDTGKGYWIFDSFTSGTFHDGYFFLLTYNKVLKVEKKMHSFEVVDSKRFNSLKQREGICVDEHSNFYISNEYHKWFGDQKIERIRWKK